MTAISFVVGAFAHSAFVGMIPNAANVPGRAALGHTNKIGGGTLSVFGQAFLAAGKTWRPEVCLGDSDGDGESNGAELGDPCCQWQFGLTPPYKRATDPSDPSKVSGRSFNSSAALAVYQSKMLPLVQRESAKSSAPSAAQLAAVRALAQQHGAVCEKRIQRTPGRPATPKSSHEHNREPSKAPHKAEQPMFADGLEHFMLFSGKSFFNTIIVLGYLRIVWLVLHNGSCGYFVGTWDGRRKALVLILFAFLYVEFTSGLLHIFADNKYFVDWPVIGGLCRSFQDHHLIPQGVAHEGWISFLSAISVGVVVLVVSTVCIPCAPHLGLFSTFSIPLFYLMMATHRWCHCPPDDVPIFAWVGQQVGLFMSVETHDRHHIEPHSINFSLLSGLSNGLLNWLTANVLHDKNPAWLGIFVAWAIACPVMVVLYDCWTGCKPLSVGVRELEAAKPLLKG
jgi:hypothetical protein